MAVMMIKCPITGEAVSTGIEIEADAFQELPDVSARMNCPACGRQHAWRRIDAWLADISTPTRPAV
jgi:endogenous inhibitor of DNA gyrase (YacG/DUF329 family)